MTDRERILTFLSSSELNRCANNGLSLFTAQPPQYWLKALKSDWLNKKLRRKLGWMYQMEILPVKRASYVITPEFKHYFEAFQSEFIKHLLNEEDKIILTGSHASPTKPM